jgi:hypothetical protein
MTEKNIKPLGIKAYGSIPHLPNSRMGPGDHSIDVGSAKILTEKTRDKHDRIYVSEKLDGSNCSVALLNGQILALGRAGYLASTSKFEQHQYFAAWVIKHESRFRAVLKEGERLCGEWLLQAHGTRYKLTQHNEPYVVFDLFVNNKRITSDELKDRVCEYFDMPVLLNDRKPMTVEAALKYMEPSNGFHCAIDPVEGAVWKCERNGKVDFMAKYVRLDKQDGCYLPEVSGGETIWNLNPKSLLA